MVLSVCISVMVTIHCYKQQKPLQFQYLYTKTLVHRIIYNYVMYECMCCMNQCNKTKDLACTLCLSDRNGKNVNKLHSSV